MKTLKMTLAMAVTAIAMTVGLVGCKTSVNPNTATWAGMAIHQAYTKIAATQDAQFKADIEELWAAIDQVETLEGLTNVYTLVANKIDALIMQKGLTDKQIKTIKILRKVIDKAVAQALSNDKAKQSKAIEWLVKFRDGIRLMRQMENGEDIVIPSTDCDDCCDNCVVTQEEMKILAAALKK